MFLKYQSLKKAEPHRKYTKISTQTHQLVRKTKTNVLEKIYKSTRDRFLLSTKANMASIKQQRNEMKELVATAHIKEEMLVVYLTEMFEK